MNNEAAAEKDRLERQIEADQKSHDLLQTDGTGDVDVYRRGNEIQKRIFESGERIKTIDKETKERNDEDKKIIDNLDIREKVKQIFIKYGLTVASILLAIWAVMATIIGATQSATVGDKKQKPVPVSIPSIRINKPIPIDPVINFIYDIALEVIEGLVENSFLLIELLVIFYIDGRR